MESWWTRRNEHPEDPKEIIKPNARWAAAAREPARHAIAAVMDNVHDNISIRIERGVTVIETSRGQTTDRGRMSDPAEVTRWWSKTAQSQLWRTVEPDDIDEQPRLEAILEAMSRNESRTIADWTPDPVRPPAGWTRPDEPAARAPDRNPPPTPGGGSGGDEGPPPPPSGGTSPKTRSTLYEERANPPAVSEPTSKTPHSLATSPHGERFSHQLNRRRSSRWLYATAMRFRTNPHPRNHLRARRPHRPPCSSWRPGVGAQERSQRKRLAARAAT